MNLTPESLGNLSQTQNVNLLEKRNGVVLGSEISFPSEQLGFNKWEEMLLKTQSDFKERGILTSSLFGKIETSNIFLGMSESETKNAKITLPQLPHGFKSLWPGINSLAFIHTHPKPKELDHLKTTLFSDADIRSFANLNLKAMAMIDSGGVHLLMYSGFIDDSVSLPDYNLHDAAMKKALEGNGTVIEAMKEMSKIIDSIGIRYFYSPELNQKNGYIKLQDVRQIK